MMRHAKHAINGLVALIALALFTIAVPAGLIAYVGWPLPTSIPTLDQIQLALRGGIDPNLIINTLAVIVWVIWAQLAIVLAVEMAAALRGRTARRLPVLPGLQPAVAQLVAAITLAVATLGPMRALPAAATPLAASLVDVSAQPVLDIDEGPWQRADDQQPTRSEAPTSHPTYRVQRHDTLWKIAEDTLANGRRWNEIQTLNAGRTMNDGYRFTETTDTLTPGWQLLLPADANTTDEPAATEQPATEQAATEVAVEPGDAFWNIAQTTLADAWGRLPSNQEIADYWRQLVDMNLDRLAPPHEPDLIYPGQVFELPPVPSDLRAETASPPPAEGPAKITVAQGDTFWSIAETTLTDALDEAPTTTEVADYWRQLVDMNLDRLAPPHDPDLIDPGQVFELPAIPGNTAPAVEPETGWAEPSVDVPPPSTSTPDTTHPDATPQTIVPAQATSTPTAPPMEDTTSPRTIQADDIEPADIEAADDTADAGPFGDLFPIAVRLAGLGILGAGVVGLLRRLRAGQLRRRRTGTAPTPPPAEAQKTEATIRASAAPTATEFVDIALRAMVHDVNAAHQQPPHVVGVHLSPHTLRLLLWTPHTNPPPGWAIDDGGRSWTLSATTDAELLRRKATAVPAPYPTLVTVGHTGDVHLLLDLEFAGATRVTGEPDDLLDTCATIATELATTPLADGIHIMCVGFGDGLEQLERITVVDNLTDVLPILEAKTAAVEVTATTPLDGRLSPINDGTWDPIVVLDPAQEAPDGADRLLVMAQSGRGVAALVGYPTGDELLSFSLGNFETVRVAMDYSPDGTRLAIVGPGSAVYDAATGDELLGWISDGTVAYSPDGTRIVVGGAWGWAAVLDATTGEEQFTLSLCPGPTSWVWEAAWSPDGTRLATTCRTSVRVWDATTGDELLTIPSLLKVTDLAWSPDGTRIATAGRDGKIAKVWDANTGDGLVTLIGHTGKVWVVAWSPEGNRIATAGSDGTARIWDAGSGDELATLTGHTDEVTDVAWSPDGTRIATASDDGTVKIWTVR
ncbi:MAG: LysM peptidoglycan-binding domain-containing protein [Acidimicrobiia bacterium]|nr:LysM peptidoglycan-binding domain-containing protein [Acidimicrobiia bacterium]